MRFLMLCLLLALFGNVVAEEVYRWTDANGQVHYGTRPPQGNAEKILMRSPQAVSNDGKSEDARAQMRKNLLQSYERERELKKNNKARLAAEQRRKALRCKQLTRHWKNLHHYGPIYYQNKIGGREFLNEKEREAEKEGLKSDLRTYCGKLPSV